MLGIIKKDLFMIKNNYKFIIIAFIIYIFYSFQFEMDMSFFLPFMGLMSSISTFSYDDYNNFHAYSSTFPQGKKGIVKSKFITTLLVIFFLSIISIIISYIISLFKININFIDNLSAIIGILFAMIIMISLLFPFLFKYGAEKGRIALIAIAFGIFGFVTILVKLININISDSILLFVESYFPFIFIIISIIALLISYLISVKLYLKREF